MLSINKTYCWLFVAAMLIQIPSIFLMKFLEELLVVFLMCLVMLDVVVNRRYKRYKLLWALTGLMAFYAIYSMTCVSYNTTGAIVSDFIAQMKPFCYFFISYAIAPKFDTVTKRVLKGICIFNALTVVVCFSMGIPVVKATFLHVAYLGLLSLISFMVYLMCSVDENGKLSKADLIIAVVILTCGLTSTRAKFYGAYVLALYMLFFYKPGLMKTFSLKHGVILLLTFAATLWVTWEKIEYYFINGGQEDMIFDEELMHSFARPMLYIGMLMLLIKHPFFGGGLASFASNASSGYVSYSGAYAELGLDQVWGLSEDFGNFICDAYYPSLAQFGIVGIVLFCWFFIWIYKRLSLMLHTSSKVLYSVGLMAIVVILIESVASTTFTQGAGAMCMMILGCITSQFKNLSKAERKALQQLPYKETESMEYLMK